MNLKNLIGKSVKEIKEPIDGVYPLVRKNKIIDFSKSYNNHYHSFT